MFENDQICPYTGLRSFTEDESLYFKGREEDIDLATGQLQRNKFLMITGASGDGKSSLVYAGVIPNARSGFLKSTYSNWSVASLRPERSPFKNLCNAISKELGIANAITVQGELSHGFSALVDLYKNSSLYIDIHSSEWITADDQQKARMKREASNLIVLVDQFEEFFTNPENYHLGAPSRDANLVLNVLLETARIALEEDLPIYVIFTMRSDYIGQCAAFRGLPEYLGFSQFFVPRMNRTQLQQVIEEPAKLSGNRITRRLTERLIHDLTEGVDQLPILQHALNQIWVAADRGNAEMDLIHYAKVGGMSVDELPEEQVETFNQWFDALPAEIKACYHAPSLQNVLDTHTNKLYEQAAGYYTEKTGKPIAAANAKMIIRTAFTCLTKIDQSRAVRNRMTLQEITNILANPAFDAKAVGEVLNIFREPGNTFIHPFISADDPESLELLPDQVLDITHESLIRNWQYLGQWARAEHESHTISLDFEKQLDRWVNSGKSNNFLLSIGPLTYFETWYDAARPNAWWIARYLPGETATEVKLDKANEIIGNAKDFLKRSARSHAITRMFMRYGPKRVAAVVAIIALLTLTSFTIAKYLKKQNGYLLKDIHDQTLALTNNPKVNIGSKVTLIAEEMKIGQLQLDDILPSVTDRIQRINIINGVASLLIFQGRSQPRVAIIRSLKLTDSLLQAINLPETNAEDLSRALRELNDFRVTLELANFYNPEPEFAAWRKSNGQRAGQWVLDIVEKQPAGFTDMLNLNLALENALNNNALSPDDIQKLLSKLSPFEGGLQSDWLKSNFYKDKLQIRGSIPQNYGFSNNGLYQELAYLYAASGNSGKALQCLDTLLANSPNNFQGDYANNMDNASNIAAVFFLDGKTDQLDEFVSGYCEKKKISAIEFYERLLGRMVIGIEGNLNLELYDFMAQVMNLNLQFWSKKQLEFFFSRYRNAILQGKDKNLINFQLALSYKNEGILGSLSSDKTPGKVMTVKENFDKAIALYHEIDPRFLEQAVPIVVESGQDVQMMPRKVLFIYPDLRLAFQPMEPRSFFFYYLSDVYLAYILDNHLFTTFYPTLAELNLLPAWLRDYSTKNISTSAYRINESRYEVLKKFDSALEQRADAKNADFNFLYLYLGKDAQDAGDQEEMVRIYSKFDYDRIFNLLTSKDINGRLRDQSFRMIAYAMTGLIKADHFDQAMKFASMFKSPVNRSTLYAFTAGELLGVQFDRNMIRRLVDSATLEMTRLENLVNNQPNRALIASDQIMLSDDGSTSKSFQLIRNVPDKFYALMLISKSLATKDRLYEALQNIPAFMSATDRADFLTFIVYGYSFQKGIVKEDYQEFAKHYPFSFWYIHYIDESF